MTCARSHQFDADPYFSTVSPFQVLMCMGEINQNQKRNEPYHVKGNNKERCDDSRECAQGAGKDTGVSESIDAEKVVLFGDLHGVVIGGKLQDLGGGETCAENSGARKEGTGAVLLLHILHDSEDG